MHIRPRPILANGTLSIPPRSDHIALHPFAAPRRPSTLPSAPPRNSPCWTDSSCSVPSCFWPFRRSRGARRPTSPPPPSSHSLVPPTRFGRWKLQARARLRLQAGRLAQLPRWHARLSTDMAGAGANGTAAPLRPTADPCTGPESDRPTETRAGHEDEPGPHDGVGTAPTSPTTLVAATTAVATNQRWRLLPRVRFSIPTLLPSMPSIPRIRRRSNDDTKPDEMDEVPRPDTPSVFTAHTRATSADYDAYGPTLALRLKNTPRRWSM